MLIRETQVRCLLFFVFLKYGLNYVSNHHGFASRLNCPNCSFLGRDFAYKVITQDSVVVGESKCSHWTAYPSHNHLSTGANGMGDFHLDGSRPMSSCHVYPGEAHRAELNRHLTSIWWWSHLRITNFYKWNIWTSHSEMIIYGWIKGFL